MELKKENEDITLNATSFDNISAMLASSDLENTSVAFAILENCNKIKSLTYLLLLKKADKPKSDVWKKEAPVTYNFLKGVGADPDKIITFKQGLNILINQKASPNDVQFYLDYFGKYIYESIKKMGYDFVEGIDVKLKIKQEDVSKG